MYANVRGTQMTQMRQIFTDLVCLKIRVYSIIGIKFGITKGGWSGEAVGNERMHPSVSSGS